MSNAAQDPTTEALLSQLDALGYKPKIARPPSEKRAANAARMRAVRQKQSSDRKRDIAVLDFETDPFDHKTKTPVFPFLAILHSDQFEDIIIWEENHDKFIRAVLHSIENLPRSFTIYAHNGGKFDYLFFISRLRGECMFKGRAIMSCRVGNHELRDSLHIIPERLAGYKKDDFDYRVLKKTERSKHAASIIRYCRNDCIYLLQIIRKFVDTFGLKLSIGQAAMAEIKRHYKIDNLSEHLDAKLRGIHDTLSEPNLSGRPNGEGFFLGGRVECLAGKGIFEGPYHLYDVNSMYPYVMATYNHPIGREYFFRDGKPNQYTAFVVLYCDNYGGLVKRTDRNETSAEETSGIFHTTIWEYNTAIRLGLIGNVRIIRCVDCDRFSNFSKFVIPLYKNRLSTKRQLSDWEKSGKSLDHDTYLDIKKEDMFYKFLLNNGYGKFAQNPRRFKEHYITDPEDRPPPQFENCGDFPDELCENYAIWSRPSPGKRFNNVGTGASITGAARAVLMEAISNAIDPIYCDTDSVICRGFLENPLSKMEIDNERLGAWKIEKTYDRVIVAGKKQYAAIVHGQPETSKKRVVIKSKGVTGLTWTDYENLLLDEIVKSVNFAPTITRTGRQFYMERSVRATGPQHAVSFAARRLAR